MLKDKSASVALFRTAAALILACCLVHTVDCYRLKKADKRKYAPEGFRRGKIVLGKVSHGDPVLDGEVKANISVEDGAAYQADSAGGWGINPVPLQQPESLEASWRRLTSLQCGDNHMKLRVKPPGLSHLSVLQAPNAAPLPLPLVPLNCGYNMHRNSLGFLMYVPYGGCYILQQAGSYVLPMHWQGVPVTLICTKHAPTDVPKPTTLLPSDPVVTRGPNVSQVPKWLAVSKNPGPPLKIWSQNEPRSLVQFPPLSPRSSSGLLSPMVQSPHPVPYLPKWQPAVHSPVSHPGLQKPPVLQDPFFNFKLPPPQNPVVSQYPVMPHVPYVHNYPRPYQVPQTMGQYPFFNPYLWPFPGHHPKARNPSQKGSTKPATLSKFPYFPHPSIPPMQTTRALTTTVAPATDTTLLPYNPLFQFPPELMHYISYEDLLAAMYANQ
ncbi:proline-rich protein 36-like [Phycodurus eques]|uniref:proline-rich protein 36-like n=1 Tax=Phycodurus eques TaxID=693459 RepID=UPI002ACE38A5|nr:proline-rich protein 36-like [Phycodurus eques]